MNLSKDLICNYYLFYGVNCLSKKEIIYWSITNKNELNNKKSPFRIMLLWINTFIIMIDGHVHDDDAVKEKIILSS